MPTRKPKSAKAQSKAFIDAAREAGADESSERFDAALKVIGKHKDKAPVLRPVRRGQPKATG